MVTPTVEKALKEAESCRSYQDFEMFKLFILDPLQDSGVSVGDIRLYERKALRNIYSNILEEARYNAEREENRDFDFQYHQTLERDALKIARELGIDEKIVKARFADISETVEAWDRTLVDDETDRAVEQSMKFRADYSWD